MSNPDPLHTSHHLVDLPDTSEIYRKVAELQSRAGKLHEEQKHTQEEVEAKRKTEREDALGLGQGLQIAYSIVGFPVLGFVVGLGLDHWLGTGYWKGFIGLGGCVLAVITSMVLIRQANRTP
jgi:F0F1-type ATP synthase assembly protein I